MIGDHEGPLYVDRFSDALIIRHLYTAREVARIARVDGYWREEEELARLFVGAPGLLTGSKVD